MNDYLVLLFQIIIAILLVIFPTVALGVDNHYWLVSLVFVIVFYLVQCGLSQDVFNLAFAGLEQMTADGNAKHLGKDKIYFVNNGGVIVDDGVFGDIAENYYGTRIPLMGPYDGVRPSDIQKKLTTAEYQKTAYPYRPMTNYGTMTPGDNTVGQKLLLEQTVDVGGVYYKQDVERWYPDTNRLTTNTRDCTNYPAGHPGSCLINSERTPSMPEVVSTLNNPIGYSVGNQLLDEELTAKEERFGDIASTPKLLKSGKPWPTLFKNAPGNIQFDTGVSPPPILGISGELCRTCKVSGCMKDSRSCGSRQDESSNGQGTNDIISPVGYMADFLRDIALV